MKEVVVKVARYFMRSVVTAFILAYVAWLFHTALSIVSELFSSKLEAWLILIFGCLPIAIIWEESR